MSVPRVLSGCLVPTRSLSVSTRKPLPGALALASPASPSWAGPPPALSSGEWAVCRARWSHPVRPVLPAAFGTVSLPVSVGPPG